MYKTGMNTYQRYKIHCIKSILEEKQSATKESPNYGQLIGVTYLFQSKLNMYFFRSVIELAQNGSRG